MPPSNWERHLRQFENPSKGNKIDDESIVRTKKMYAYLNLIYMRKFLIYKNPNLFKKFDEHSIQVRNN